MKKISRRSFITAMAAVSAAGVLAACGSSSSSMASSMAFSPVFHGGASSFRSFFRCIQRSSFLCRIYG